jgi:glycosyltransferase involved in cell wall biosynthesis
MPAFHAIMVVREEGDIIAQTLAHVLSWADAVYIFDTGSTDNTWDTIQQLATRDKRLKPLGREPVLFTDSIRGWLFSRIRQHIRPGDWVARIDADEFDHIPPPTFVKERLSGHEARIFSCQYDFMLSRPEVKAWQDGIETTADRARDIRERRRNFRFDDYSEQRLFRYRRGLSWPLNRVDPLCGGLIARERIPVLHYRARDPLQIQVRCAIREPTADTGTFVGWHWTIADWRQWVFDDNDPTMVHWAPGTPLPEHPLHRFHFKPWGRFKAHVYHRSGAVHLHDRFRPTFPSDWRPTPLDPQIQNKIAHNLAQIRATPYLRDCPPQVKDKRDRLRTQRARQ